MVEAFPLGGACLPTPILVSPSPLLLRARPLHLVWAGQSLSAANSLSSHVPDLWHFLVPNVWAASQAVSPKWRSSACTHKLVYSSWQTLLPFNLPEPCPLVLIGQQAMPPR